MALTDPVLVGPADGRTATSDSGSTAELKITGEQTGGAWAVVDWHVRAGDEPPMHTHTREDESVYVVEGSITAYLGDQTIEVEAGSYAALPKGIPHTLKVKGGAAHLLVTEIPAGFEYFLVPRDDTDADPAKFGVELVDAPAAS
jgi:quercetin dioxygenase-like cupin family protein